MTLIIQDIKNSDKEITTWNGAPFVVEFRKEKDSSRHVNYGFDWVEIDHEEKIRVDSVEKPNPDYGKIIKHHGISILNSDNNSLCQFLLNMNSNEYVSVKNDNQLADRRKFYKKEFPVFSCNNNRLHSATAWLCLSGENMEANLIMAITANGKIKRDAPSAMYFKISNGIKLYIGGKVFDSSSVDKKYEITSTNNIKIKIKYEETLREDVFLTMEVHNCPSAKQDTTTIIGKLNINVFNLIENNVLIFPTIDSSKYSTLAEMDKAAGDLQLNQSELDKLNVELAKRYDQAGIKLIAKCANTFVLYNTRHPKYKKYKSWTGLKFELSGPFFSLIEDDFDTHRRLVVDKTNTKEHEAINDVRFGDSTKYPKNYVGTIVLLLDRNSEKRNIGNPSNVWGGNQGSIDKVQGYAYPRLPNCLLFKNSKTDYGIYAHEIGHTLGLTHTFHDDGSKESTKTLDQKDFAINYAKYYAVIDESSDGNEEPEGFENYLNSNPNEKEKYDMANRDLEAIELEDQSLEEVWKKKNEVYMKKYEVCANYYGTPAVDDTYVKNAKTDKKEAFDTLEKALYTEKSTYIKSYFTANVMDYADTHDDFFKWQWLKLRRMAETRTEN